MDDSQFTNLLLMALIPGLPLFGAAFNLIIGRKTSRRTVHVVGVGVVVASCACAVILVAGPLWEQYDAFRQGQADGVLGLEANFWTWIEVGRLKLDLAFRIDTLTAVMILIVTFVGSLIHLYSTGYMAHDPRYATYFGYLNLFTGAMLILVLADNLPVMFIGWEGVGLCSYLLIGFWFNEEQNAYAGRKAFIVNRIGDFAFLLGMCLLFWATGSLSFQDFHGEQTQKLFEAGFFGGERLAAFAGILLFIGACGKSAQIPLYVWLPDAMAGPTPVSALIHAATMVTAGVYMIARLSWLYMSSTTAMFVVSTIGALTALFAAIIAFAQTDIKKVLAYSTVSQLGFMFVAVGVGAYVAGVFHLLTHAFFKAGLFLGAGSVMHAMSNRGDIRIMGGLRKKLPWTHLTFLVYCLAIAGFPLLSGFFSKDEILAGAFAANLDGWPPMYGKILFGILTAAAFCTAFYMFRLYFLVFAGENRAPDEIKPHIHESPWTMTVPLMVLAAFTVVLGILGLPHVELGGTELPNVLHSWLSPALREPLLAADGHHALNAPSHLGTGAVLGLMGAATVVGLLGIAAAWFVYGKGPSKLVEDRVSSGAGAWIHRVVSNKFYVDELYDLIIVRPFSWLGQGIFVAVDRFIIDLLVVEGSAFIVDAFGRVVRWFQNGQVQRYIVALLIGSALLFFLATRSSTDFTWTKIGPTTVRFVADIGDGPAGQDAEIEWDFDGDGKADSTKPDVTHRFTGAGTHEVTLRITSGPFRSKETVTHSVTLTAPNAPANQGGAR